MRSLRLIIPPATEPATLGEAKLHLRVDGTEEDNLIAALITAARQKAEDYTRRAFITQTWELALDSACGVLHLPRPPVQAVETITVDGVAAAAENYALVSPDVLHIKVPLYAANPGGVVIRYRAGYGDTSADVPQSIRQAILMLLAHMYEAREGQAPQVEYEAQAGAGADMPPTVAALLRPYRVMLL